MSASEMHMITFNSARSIRRFKLFGMVLSLLGLMISAPAPSHGWAVAPQAAECQSGVGGRLFSNGGEVEVEMLPADAGFTVELHLVSPGPQRLIGTNRNAGSIVKLGSFPAGVELIFGVFVMETQRTFVMGPGSGNPDGLPHAEVTCFGGNGSNVGFEDQLGGGDSDYNDLLCTVRQPQNICNYSISPASQSFGSGGGSGTVNLSASAGCSWTATSDVSWVNITSGSGGSDSGTINYSVAVNTSTDSRTGTITLQGQTFTVYQGGAPCNYSISPASQSFGSGGGSGTVNLSASAGCSWTATSDVSWVNITSGSGGSDTGTINYSVAVNSSTDSRTGTITLQGQTFTVYQDGDGSLPLITGAVRKGKKLLVYGLNFDSGSVLLLNGEQQKTIYDGDNPSTVVIGKKAGKWVQPGDVLRVRSPSGALSTGYTYTP